MGMHVGPQAGKSKRERPIPVMNVTPLVDIALVVLIIFMVIVPMMEKSFWLNLPKKEQDDDKKPEQPQAADDGPLVMTVDERGVIRVNKLVLDKSEIPVRLPRMLAAQPLPVVYFDASDEVPYGQAVEVMDLAKQSGAKAIAMLTQKVAK